MPSTIDFLRKACEKCGFLRENYDDSKVPTDPSRICILPFFGDIRSVFVLSTLLLKRFREEEKGSKYFVVASWPGMGGLFPFASEFWGISDPLLARKLYQHASQFRNKSNLVHPIYRGINEYFFEDMVLADEQFSSCYREGLQNGFWDRYKQIVRFLPAIPSTAVLGKEFNRELSARGGYKVFIFPTTHVQRWQFGDINSVHISKDFWIALVNKLLAERFVPVVYKSFMTYDLSGDLTGKCIFVDEPDVTKVLAIMRATGCVLDLFSGVSRLALAARCPFVMVDERQRYAAVKEFELDDLAGRTLPKQYIFSFHTIIEGGTIETWNENILQGIVAKLNTFLPDLDRDNWPSTGESFEQVPYETIRKTKLKRLGARLLKVPRD